MGKFKFTLSTLWFYVAMVLTCLLIENIAFLSPVPTAGFTDEIYFFVAGLTVLTMLIYLISEHRRNKLTLDWVLAPILLILLVCNVIAILSNPDTISFFDEEGKEIIVGFTQMDKIRYVINVCVGTLAIYLVSFVFSRGKIKSRKLMWVPLIGVFVCTGLAVASIFLDKAFFEALKGGYMSRAATGCKSLFVNENAFGYYMLIGLIFSFIVIYQKPKWLWMWLFAIFLFFFVIFSTSTTCIILAMFAVIAFTTVQLVFGFVHKHYVTSAFGTIIFLGFIVASAMLIYIGNENTWKPMIAVANFIKKEIFEKDFETFTGRKQVWETTVKLVNATPFKAFFGYGFGISNRIFSAQYAMVDKYAELKSVHSGYLTVLLDGGWIRFGFYILLLGYFVYCLIRLIIKKQVNFALSYFVFFLTFIGHDFFETSHFFEFNVNGLLTTALVLMPPIIAWKNYRHPKHVDRIMHQYAMPTQGVPARNFVSMLALFVISVAVPMSCCLLVPCLHTNPFYFKLVLGILIFLGATVLFAPYLVFLWYKKATDRRFIWRILLNSVWILGIPAALALVLILKLGFSNSLAVLLAIAAYAVCLILGIIIYSICRKGSFVQWVKETFFSIFVNNIVGIVSASVVVLVGFIVVPLFVELTLKTLLIVGIAGVEIFWAMFLIIPSKKKDNMLNDFNEESILELKRLALEDRR